ncbi:uncharacterized protein LOC119077118 [Bradysia coprophila]|uniref:uncharacterized protein LOC119077118 n=1 Tax=Bradysia coprophila TaxID=38358 RepID=UPI00187D8C69|nr:uncharacterized protein LOC119077118 [Bradysia coprophila]XP_037040184.1 uncharacterized protein LOC119077118 [Bradysia coprophila]
MKKLLLVTSLLHTIALSLCAPSPRETHKSSNTTYDQRQVGKYNIHFNIKDVAIIALSSEDIVDHIGDSDSYADYYDYEDSEFTVNPITADLIGKPTTSKPTSSHQTLFPSIAGLNLSSIPMSSESSATTASVPETLVVIHDKPSMPSISQENDKVTESSSVSYQPDQIPVQVIVEPILKPKTRPSVSPSMKRKITNRQVSVRNDDDDYEVRPRRRRGQIIERMRLRRAQNRRNGNGCENGQVSDGQIGCRVRRSGMGAFLGMLAKFLPTRDNEE